MPYILGIIQIITRLPFSLRTIDSMNDLPTSQFPHVKVHPVRQNLIHPPETPFPNKSRSTIITNIQYIITPTCRNPVTEVTFQFPDPFSSISFSSLFSLACATAPVVPAILASAATSYSSARGVGGISTKTAGSFAREARSCFLL